jgi:hypothetical protein
MLAIPGTLSLAWESCNPEKKVGKCSSANKITRMRGVSDPTNQTICMQNTGCAAKLCQHPSGAKLKKQAIGGPEAGRGGGQQKRGRGQLICRH